MSRYVLRRASEEAVRADERRFGDEWAAGVIRESGLQLDLETVKAYGRWWIGRGWKSTWGQGWGDGAGYPELGQVADHVATRTSSGGFCYNLHTKCKYHVRQKRGFHWTRCLIVDLDAHGNETSSLRSRYDACARLFGTPAVLRSPGGGLHLHWPLLAPMSVFGFTARGPINHLRVLVPDVLGQTGLEVRAGEVEVFPRHNHTIRLPLAPRMVQLDPVTLEPLPAITREEQIARLVATMSDLAAGSPVDAERLAESVALAGKTVGSPERPATVPTGQASASRGRLDVERLLSEGLYAPGTRNLAAMELARRMMLVVGLTKAETIQSLMRWTEEKHNGFSKDGGELQKRWVRQKLEREYRRICEGIEQGVASGKLKPLSTHAHGQPWPRALSANDAERIFAATGHVSNPRERYWLEVFLFSLVGYCRDWGKAAPNADPSGRGLEVHARLSSRVLQRLPRCSAGRYRGRLVWAARNGFVTMVKNYRRSQDPRLSRCRTYAAEIDPVGQPIPPVNAWVLHGAVRRLRANGRRKVHPRQVEHALAAHVRWGADLKARYGSRATGLIHEFVRVATDPAAALAACLPTADGSA